MTVKQISVFVENKPGQLAEFAALLRKNSIDMRALSIAETQDFGILRIIVNDSYKTACVLKDEGYVFSITPVLAVAVPDQAGSLYEILKVLGTAASTWSTPTPLSPGKRIWPTWSCGWRTTTRPSRC